MASSVLYLGATAEVCWVAGDDTSTVQNGAAQWKTAGSLCLQKLLRNIIRLVSVPAQGTVGQWDFSVPTSAQQRYLYCSPP